MFRTINFSEYRLKSILLTVLFICIFLLYIETAKALFLGEIVTDDYSTYWAAGRLNINGGNPYNNDDVVKQLRELIPSFEPFAPMVMFYPPWIFPLIMPFGLLSYSLSRILWLVLNTIIIVYCANRAWLLYEGPRQQRWIAWILPITFLQAIVSLREGNITAFVLLGVTGFISSIDDEKKDLFTGAFIAFCIIKPHLVYLFLLAMLLWVIEHKRWRILLGFGGALLLFTGITFLVNPNIFIQYWTEAGHYAPIKYAIPTIGTWLRVYIFGWDKFWIQYVPPILGGIWFLTYWRKNHQIWSWLDKVPILLLLSIITTAFAWSHDQVVLVLIVSQIFTLLIRSSYQIKAFFLVLIYLVTEILYFYTVHNFGDFWAMWVAPVLFVWYCFCINFTKPEEIGGDYNKNAI